MNITVTGGSGFIGSHVIDALRNEGHSVTNIDMVDRGNADTFEKADIRDVDQITEVLTRNKIEAVFNLAAVANARQALDDPITAVDMNIKGAAVVLEAARRASVQRVVMASTVWYFNAVDRSIPENHTGPKILDETSQILPEGGGHIYTTSKIAAELLCHDFQKLYGQEFTILRFGIPYGPRMWPGLALRAFMDNVFSDKPIQIFGDGSALRRFVYVEDIAKAHCLALSDAAINQTYNLEGERDVTIKELAETVTKHAGKGTIEYVIDASRRGELVMDSIEISNAKAERDLGWKPETQLDEGVRRAVNWYQSEVLKQ
ncbi:MAG: UDP-glucose 4-epimerase [Chloroflexi bacterium]|nr:UDP-glucose 4-epimerase [Chloroflexota bacterium]|tara:strand:- start:40634 stop:41584 length:951 start_codon:yes stop_codon:yes gene_type:complete